MYTKETIKPYVIQCMAMNLSEKESLTYLNDRGFKISRQYFFKLKKSIKESRFDRLALIAKSQFVDQHLERIDTLELIQQEMWRLFREKDYKGMDALLKIAELQTYLSPYYDASRYVMEKSIQEDDKQKKINPYPLYNSDSPLLSDYKDASPETMEIIPVNFGTEHKQMLSHLYLMINEDYLAIPEKYEKLIISLRTATANEYSLDKQATSYDDILDALRLSLKGYSLG
jgi:hypothetical protein